MLENFFKKLFLFSIVFCLVHVLSISAACLTENYFHKKRPEIAVRKTLLINRVFQKYLFKSVKSGSVSIRNLTKIFIINLTGWTVLYIILSAYLAKRSDAHFLALQNRKIPERTNIIPPLFLIAVYGMKSFFAFYSVYDFRYPQLFIVYFANFVYYHGFFELIPHLLGGTVFVDFWITRMRTPDDDVCVLSRKALNLQTRFFPFAVVLFLIAACFEAAVDPAMQEIMSLQEWNNF